MMPEGYDFRFVRSDELEPLGYPGGWLRLEEARHWLENRSAEMLAVLCQGRICAYMWVEREFADVDFVKLKVPLPEGHIYLSKVLVLPEHRKRGLAKAMYHQIARTFSEATSHSACVAENLPMHLLFSRLEWSPRLLLWVWQLGPVRWYGIEQMGGGGHKVLRDEAVSRLLFVNMGGHG